MFASNPVGLDPFCSGNPRKEHTNNADNERALEGGPKPADLEAQVKGPGKLSGNQQHQSIDYEGEESEREDDQWQGKESQQGLNERIHYPENSSDSNHLPPLAGEDYPVNDLHSDRYGQGIDQYP